MVSHELPRGTQTVQVGSSDAATNVAKASSSGSHCKGIAEKGNVKFKTVSITDAKIAQSDALLLYRFTDRRVCFLLLKKKFIWS